MRRHQDERECFPRFEEISEMSEDLVCRLPARQTEIWRRVLYRLSLKAQSPWSERLTLAVLELKQGLSAPIDHARWCEPVDWEEAYQMGFDGPIMSPHSALILKVLISAMELRLGPDHVDIQPMHRYRCGLRDRITMLLEKGLDATPDA